jgi:hypothetical protein
MRKAIAPRARLSPAAGYVMENRLHGTLTDVRADESHSPTVGRSKGHR